MLELPSFVFDPSVTSSRALLNDGLDRSRNRIQRGELQQPTYLDFKLKEGTPGSSLGLSPKANSGWGWCLSGGQAAEGVSLGSNTLGLRTPPSAWLDLHLRPRCFCAGASVAGASSSGTTWR